MIKYFLKQDVKEKYMADGFKEYFFLSIDEKHRKAYLLGYELKLTPTEFKILDLIFEHGQISPDEMLPYLPARCTRRSIPVHVSAINKKALAISGRLFIDNSKAKYFFAENM